MRRTVLGLVAVSAGLLLLGACGGGDESSKPGAGAKQSFVVAAPWPNIGHDARHTGRTPSALPSRLAQVWKSPDVQYGGQWNSAPVVGPDGTIYFTVGESITAVAPTGGLRWSRYLGRSTEGAAVGMNGTIYVALGGAVDEPGTVLALSPGNQERWRYSTVNSISGKQPVAAPDGTVYVGDAKALYALRPDGTLKWRAVTAAGASTPAVDRAVVYVTVQPDYVHRSATGGIDWCGDENRADGPEGRGCFLYAFTPAGVLTAMKGFPERLSPPSILPDGSAVFTSRDRSVYAYAPDGRERWHTLLDNRAGTPDAPAIGADGTVYVVDENLTLYALDPASGARRWARQVFPPATTLGFPELVRGPVIDGSGALYLTTYLRGIIIVLNPAGDERARIDVQPYIVGSAPPAIAANRLYVVGRWYNASPPKAALFAIGRGMMIAIPPP